MWAKLWRDTRGSAAIMLLLGLVPVFMLGYGALEYTEYSTLMTRVQQSQMQALYAVAKEGADYLSLDCDRQGKAWMEVNIESLNRTEATTFSHTVSPSSSDVTVSTTFQGTSISQYLTGAVTQELRAYYYSKPIEVVFALDASPSFKNYASSVQAAVEAGADQLFKGSDEADDVWASLLFAASWVNIGTTYADKLVNSESGKPYYDYDEVTQLTHSYMDAKKIAYIDELRAETESMLQTYYPMYANDLLAEGAPGYNVDILCVHRASLDGAYYNDDEPDEVSDSAIEDYVAQIFEAPTSDANRFDMVQGVAWPIKRTDENQAIRLPKNGVLMATAAAGAYMTDSNSRASTSVGYEGVALSEVAFLNLDPSGKYYKKISQTLGDSGKLYEYSKWGSYTGLSANYTQPMVTAPGGCPRAPMLIGSQKASELTERAAMWGTAVGRASDESLAWAIRALEPEYEDIWGIDDYPAPYPTDGGEREKRIIWIADDDTSSGGYASKSWGGADVITPMCEAAIERGIDIYILERGDIGSDTEEIFTACADDDHRFSLTSTFTNLEEVMIQACHRDTRIVLDFTD